MLVNPICKAALICNLKCDSIFNKKKKFQVCVFGCMLQNVVIVSMVIIIIIIIIIILLYFILHYILMFSIFLFYFVKLQ